MQPILILRIHHYIILGHILTGRYPPKKVTSDLAWNTFFFLLCPGEYFQGVTDTENHPFNFQDTQLFIVDQHFKYVSTQPTKILRDIFSLLFIAKNNSAKRGCIGHGRIWYP